MAAVAGDPLAEQKKIDAQLAADEAKELEELSAEDRVNDDSLEAMSQLLANMLTKKAIDNRAQAKETDELHTLNDKDLVNPDSLAAMATLLANKFAKKRLQTKKEAKELEELKRIAGYDAVNENSKNNLAGLLAKKHKSTSQGNTDAAEEKKELEAVASLDTVNEDSKNKLAGLLSKKHASTSQGNTDAAEEKKELAAVASLDTVNEDSKNNLAGLLAKKLATTKQGNKSAEAEKKELEHIAGLDKVNNSSISNLGALLEKKHMEAQFKSAIKELLDLIDHDKNGQVDIKELHNVYPEDLSLAVLSMHDTDKDGMLSVDEMMTMFMSPSVPGTQKGFLLSLQGLIETVKKKTGYYQKLSHRKELTDVALWDLVNPDTKDAMSAMLHKIHVKKFMDQKAELQEKKELAKVAELDTVNEKSKSKLAALLAKHKKKPDMVFSSEFQAAVQQLVDMIECDGSTGLSLEELLKAYPMCGASLMADFDKDGDKSLSVEEILPMFLEEDGSGDEYGLLAVIRALKHTQHHAKQAATVDNMMEEKEEKELAALKNKDLVNADSKAALAGLLSKKKSVGIITYWNGFGRGEAVRMACIGADCLVENNRIETKEDWKKLKETSMWGQAPKLDIDGISMTQTGACVRYMARRGNIYGDSAEETYLVDTVLDATTDFYGNLMKYPWSMGSEEFQEKAKKAVARYFPRFEKQINAAGNGFFVGSRASVADFVFYGCWRFMHEMCKNEKSDLMDEIKKTYPAITKNMENIGQIRRVKKYVMTDAKLEWVSFKAVVTKTLS